MFFVFAGSFLKMYLYNDKAPYKQRLAAVITSIALIIFALLFYITIIFNLTWIFILVLLFAFSASITAFQGASSDGFMRQQDSSIDGDQTLKGFRDPENIKGGNKKTGKGQSKSIFGVLGTLDNQENDPKRIEDLRFTLIILSVFSVFYLTYTFVDGNYITFFYPLALVIGGYYINKKFNRPY